MQLKVLLKLPFLDVAQWGLVIVNQKMDTTEDDWKRITIFFAVRTSLPQFVLFKGVIYIVRESSLIVMQRQVICQ